MLCNAYSGKKLLCPACYADLPWHKDEVCPICAIPTRDAMVCGACLKSAPAFNATFAALSYQFPSDSLLQAYKYGEQLHLGSFFAQMLAEKVQRLSNKPDIVVAMPLHPHRLKERGFNQAAELARAVAKHLHLPLALNACHRIRETPPQAGLSLRDRAKNLRGAFTCTEEVAGKTVVLVDDIMTSGASLNELAGTFKKSGASEVICWVVARTLAD